MKSLRVCVVGWIVTSLLAFASFAATTTATGAKKPPVMSNKPVSANINTQAAIEAAKKPPVVETHDAAVAAAGKKPATTIDTMSNKPPVLIDHVKVPPSITARPDDEELTMAHGGDEPLTKGAYRALYGHDPDPSKDVKPEGSSVQTMPNIADTISGKTIKSLKVPTAADFKKYAARFDAMKPAPEIRFTIIRSSETSLTAAQVPAGLLSSSLYTDKTGELTCELVLSNFGDSDERPGTYLVQISARAPGRRLVDPVYDWAAPVGLVYMEPRGLNPVFVPFKSSESSPEDKVEAAGGVNGQLMQEAFARNTTSKTYRCEFALSSKLLVAALKESGQDSGLLYVRLVPVKEKGKPGRTLDKRLTQKSIQDALSGKGAGDDTKITKREADAAARGGARVRLASNSANKWEPLAPPTSWQQAYLAGSQMQAQINAYKNEFNAFENAVNSGYKVKIVGYVPPKFHDDTDSDGVPLDIYELKRDVNVKGKIWKKGQQFHLWIAQNRLNHKTGWAAFKSDLWDLTSGTISMVSKAYEGVKNTAVNVVATALNATGVDFLSCGEQCKKNLMTGLNVALSACGLPPGIPDVGQIYANGADYMAGMIAQTVLEQATGVDLGTVGNVVKDAAAQEARKQAQSAARKGIDALANQLMQLNPDQPFKDDDPSTWGVPSSLIRAHPAVLYVEISRTGSALDQLGEATEEMNVEITYAYKYLKDRKVGDPMFEHQKSFPIYFAPGVSKMVVPVVLTQPLKPFLGLFSNPYIYDNPAYNSGDKITWYGQPMYVVNSGGSLNGNVTITTRHRAPGKTVKELLLTKTWTGKGPYPFGQPFSEDDKYSRRGYGYKVFEYPDDM